MTPTAITATGPHPSRAGATLAPPPFRLLANESAAGWSNPPTHLIGAGRANQRRADVMAGRGCAGRRAGPFCGRGPVWRRGFRCGAGTREVGVVCTVGRGLWGRVRLDGRGLKCGRGYGARGAGPFCGRGLRVGRGLRCGAGPMGQPHPTEWAPYGAAPRCAKTLPSHNPTASPRRGAGAVLWGQRRGAILGGYAGWAPCGAPPGAVGPTAITLSPLSRSCGRPSPWDRWRAGGGDQDTEWLV